MFRDPRENQRRTSHTVSRKVSLETAFRHNKPAKSYIILNNPGKSLQRSGPPQSKTHSASPARPSKSLCSIMNLIPTCSQPFPNSIPRVSHLSQVVSRSQRLPNLSQPFSQPFPNCLPTFSNHFPNFFPDPFAQPFPNFFPTCSQLSPNLVQPFSNFFPDSFAQPFPNFFPPFSQPFPNFLPTS